MTGIAYFTPHPAAATLSPGAAWWWPAIHGEYYGACLQGLARVDTPASRFGPDDSTDWWYDQYYLCFMRLREDPWDDIVDLWSKPHRVVSIAKDEGRILHEITLDQFPPGLTVFDRIGSPVRVLWNATPRDRKALRQREQRYARETPTWFRRRVRRLARVPYRPRITASKKRNHGDDRRLQQARDFGLPTPHPYWTPGSILLREEVREVQFY